MKIIRLVVLALTAALCAVPAVVEASAESQYASSRIGQAVGDVGSDAQRGGLDISDPEAFRDVLLRFARTLEAALGSEPRASAAIQKLGYEELELWVSLIPDLERFVQEVDEAVNRIHEFTSRTALAPAEPKLAQTGMFDPDYPPATMGDYHQFDMLPAVLPVGQPKRQKKRR